MTLRTLLAVVLLAGALAGCRGSGCSEQGGNPCFNPAQNRPVLPGGAAVALEAQSRPSADCFQGWGELAGGEPLRASVEAQTATRLGVPEVGTARVRAFVGPDVDGGTSRTVTRYLVSVRSPAEVAGEWVLQLPGVSASPAVDAAGVRLDPLAGVTLPEVLAGCLDGGATAP